MPAANTKIKKVVEKEEIKVSNKAKPEIKVANQRSGPLTDPDLLEVLVAEDFVSVADQKKAQSYLKERRGTLADFLLSAGILNRDLLGQAQAEYYGVPYADLNTNKPPTELVKKIPAEIEHKYHLVPYREDASSVLVATTAPWETAWLAEVRKVFGKKSVKVAFSLMEDIEATLVVNRQALDTQFTKIIAEEERIAPEIIEAIFNDAIVNRCSDIHFEPTIDDVVVRFRLDGVLQSVGRFPKKTYSNILNRIKVLSNLRIDEHSAAQDGAIRYEGEDGNGADMRVSIVPTMEGEKIVIRLLSRYVSGFSLADLGLSDWNRSIVADAASKPFGMMLVVGPTGSGKTTTLYALLKMHNSPTVNITTIEDPVEYRIAGVNQIQVNPQTNLTFAKGLRSIVRQDPDIILVGEIRDQETAEISVNAALTGHLLLSTFHANDAASAIPRLLDMGVEPFLVASTLELLIAQRLTRKICEMCRVSEVIDKKELVKKYPKIAPYFVTDKVTLYHGRGCELCNQTGYHGRTAIFEMIQISPEMEDLIMKKASSKEIWSLARSQGALSLFEDGVLKIKNGQTTIEELLRVAEPPIG